MLRRRKTATFTKSSRKAKMTAAASVPVTIKTGKGFIAIPAIASAEAIMISASDETMTQGLGSEDQIWRRSLLV